jgi:hypothetical protein
MLTSIAGCLRIFVDELGAASAGWEIASEHHIRDTISMPHTIAVNNLGIGGKRNHNLSGIIVKGCRVAAPDVAPSPCP